MRKIQLVNLSAEPLYIGSLSTLTLPSMSVGLFEMFCVACTVLMEAR